MPSVSGREVRVALKKAAVWGTAVACGAGDGILCLADSMKKKINSEVDNSLGLAFAEDRDQGNIVVEGGLPAYLRYDSHDRPIALAMGSTQAPTQQGATAAYVNSILLADNIDGLFASLAINKIINVDEFPSDKIVGFTIKGVSGQVVMIEYIKICNDKVVASIVNNLTSFANVTYLEKTNRVLFGQGVFRINAQAGGALADGDIVTPSAFEFTFKRNLKGEYVAGSANKIDEPTNEGVPEIKLKLTFARYTATTYIADLFADVKKKMDITFTGAVIEGAYSRQFKLQFPNLAYSDADAPTKEAKLDNVVEFDCLATTAAPTGMAGILKPFQVNLINKRTTSPLA
ncbi:MAG: phage tail tube protein [Thermodesulfovibrionia bacterium]|nr:phage tail tube protein [Thermodesulfovibrionia bacterium]